MEPKVIEMAALGRALHPGMLYDCRSDSFIPGVTLWDKASLDKDLDVRRQPKSDLKFLSSDTLYDKASLIDVSASLKASFLGGLIEVGGSARYMNDKKTSARQSRVTMYYGQTTKFAQLTMTQLGKITYPAVFDDKTATHVVTAVLYGAQAFMVFDQTAASNESVQEIEGKLNVMVKKIPGFCIEGSGTLKMTEQEKQMATSINCTFYGDYQTDTNPTTYMEALQLYTKLPSILRQRENDAVPMRVWLYPLARLDNRAARLEREIGETLISKSEALLEKIGEADVMCNDLIANTTGNDFPDVKQRLKTFQESLRLYKGMFLKALSKFVPMIRGGKETEQALANLLSINDKSPFTESTVSTWLENSQSELNLLYFYTQQLSAIEIMKSSGKLTNVLIDPNVDTVLCFTFTSLKNVDPYLSTVKDYLKPDQFEKLTPVPKSSADDIQFWFSNYDTAESMKENLVLFKSCFELNKNKKQIKFIIASVSDASYPGTSIRLYKKGKLVDSKFKPVSKPPALQVEIQGVNAILKLQKSPTGSTLRYRVEYRTTQDTGADPEGWKVVETTDASATYTLTGLDISNQYWVRYRAVDDVGMSEASDTLAFSLRGKLNVVPVGQSADWIAGSVCSELRKKLLTKMSISRWSLSTIQAEVTTIASNVSGTYATAIPGGLKQGMALYFQGDVPVNSKDFSINHKLGQNPNDDNAFHLNPRITVSMVRDSCRRGYWEGPQETPGCPILPGSAFDIFTVAKTEGFEHRFPVESINSIALYGNVNMNTIGLISNWSKSTFAKELSPGASRQKTSNIQSDINYPVCSPVIVNGMPFWTFKHRLPVESAATLFTNDVFMNYFGIVEVLLSIPAQI
ncbi:stonustoxin subunit beta-like [Trichomycterus rosablanca]|uniref:stonustoxin subunit beta-like n=1 Tax=Trichomycterus rosablanca TaxID=2290929 RepID=UPI002F35B119